MAAAVGYFRLPPGEAPDGKTALAARARLEAYAAHHLPFCAWRGVAVEAAAARGVAFARRGVGLRVHRDLERGDHLVLADAAGPFKDWSDFLLMLRLWEGCGVHVHLLDPPANSYTPEGRAALGLLRRFAEIVRGRRAERARVGNARRRQRGKPTNQNAPYGFRYVGPRGRRRRVPDHYTREVGRAIARWRLAGSSWNQIYFHLLQHRVRTRDGREWSVGAIQRAFRGECRLQAEESERSTTK